MDSCLDEKALSDIYSKEKKRDASSSIRGFLFQDFIAIEELLDPSTVSICNEYLEDIFVECSDCVKIIQAKYYPSSYIKKDEIKKDLQYLYIALRYKRATNKKIQPCLFYHDGIEPVAPLPEQDSDKSSLPAKELSFNIAEVLDYDGFEKFYSSLSGDKIERRDKVINRYCTTALNHEFDKNYLERSKSNLTSFSENIKDKLKICFKKEECGIELSEKDGDVLFGYATSLVTKTYFENNIEPTEFLAKQITRDYFLDKLSCVFYNRSISICYYVKSIAFELVSEILGYNDTNDVANYCFGEILKNTVKWTDGLLSDKEGQLQFINTISLYKLDDFNSLRDKTDLLTIFYEHKERIETFFKYLWKLMLDQYTTYEPNEEKRRRYLDPGNMFDSEEKQYLKADFQLCGNFNTILIGELSSSSPKRDFVRIFSRLKQIRPRRWFLKNTYSSSKRKGFLCRSGFQYSQNVSQIIDYERPQVTDFNSDDVFDIKCMNCIKVDDGDWNIQGNDYANTLFSEKCEVEDSEK